MRCAVVLAVFAVVCLAALTVEARGPPGSVKGALSLDSKTFDKVVRNYDGKVLVKFDKQYPFGEKEEEYKKLLDRVNARGVKAEKVLVAQVGVGEFGEKENDDLRTRFNLEIKDFPVYLLFSRNSQEPAARFTGEIKAEDLSRFISENTDAWIGLAGCVEKLDALAQRFAVAKNAQERSSVLAEAEKVELTDADEQESAKEYVQIMKKALEKEDFVDTENKRVDKLLKGKIAEKQKNKLTVRKNILVAFSKGSSAAAADAAPKAEL